MWSISQACPAAIFVLQLAHEPFRSRNKDSLNEVEKEERRMLVVRCH